MRLFGLIGFPLGHSFSRQFFSEKFEREGRTDCRYELFPLSSILELPALLQRHPELEGLNVTIPYKIQVLSQLTAIDPAAEAIGAVNTVAIRAGRLLGFNTDAWGFERSLEGFLPPEFTSRALVLGTGGASRAVQYVLEKRGIACTLVSRTPKAGMRTYAELDAGVFERHLLIVQTTPLGMSPDLDTSPPIPFSFLSQNHYLYELVYNPGETLFMLEGKRRGCMVKNGLEMLYLQAESAWEIWNTTRLRV
ncbi:MAG: shikimate dehydrogenase [Saprospirales bacterium]|nr:shikimate dehydrogenase [Saprospirales bacterium]